MALGTTMRMECPSDATDSLLTLIVASSASVYSTRSPSSKSSEKTVVALRPPPPVYARHPAWVAGHSVDSSARPKYRQSPTSVQYPPEASQSVSDDPSNRYGWQSESTATVS